ncbi:MAG: antitoxin VapB [Akkermansiaceae bacterium]|jgi:antitoxin VapB
MALSIRDQETDSLARELAGMTGESITEAIGKALKERLARLRRDCEFAKRKAQVDSLAARMRANMVDHVLSDDDLYDESGLPRGDA